ncbi:MAG TPA: hypothetical protein VEZ70_00305 [Allosphingosinicella sp.]|nr:hypothetical protein [Allosphingosinicella sp.]
MTRPRRLLLAFALFAAAAGWAGFWANRFFQARGEAEAAMDRLQPLLAAGLSDPASAAPVETALALSHLALAFALGGPALLLAGGLLAVWLLGMRGPKP